MTGEIPYVLDVVDKAPVSLLLIVWLLINNSPDQRNNQAELTALYGTHSMWFPGGIEADHQIILSEPFFKYSIDLTGRPGSPGLGMFCDTIPLCL